MQQQQKHPSYHSPRRNLSLGEWVILLLNLLMSGFCGWFVWMNSSLETNPSPPADTPLVHLALLLVAGATGLTGLLLGIRQTRIAAWFEWLAALGICLSAIVSIVIGKFSYSQPELLAIGVVLFIATLLFASGWFLRKIESH